MDVPQGQTEGVRYYSPRPGDLPGHPPRKRGGRERPQGAYLPPGGTVDSELAKLGQFRRRMRGKCHKFSRGFPSSVSGSFLARCQLPPKGKLWCLPRGSQKRTHALTGFHPSLCALNWRFSAGTSYFGQPQHTVRIQKIQPCSCRPPPCLNSTGIISHFFPFVYPPDFVHKLFTIFDIDIQLYELLY